MQSQIQILLINYFLMSKEYGQIIFRLVATNTEWRFIEILQAVETKASADRISEVIII